MWPQDIFPPYVIAVCTSFGGIPKRPRPGVYVSRKGLEGDGHNHEKHYRPGQEVCLMDWEILQDLRQEGFLLDCGSVGENLTIKNLSVQALPPAAILQFAGGVELELTKPRHPCYVLDAIDPRLKEAIIGRCGYYARVSREGFLFPGEIIDVILPTGTQRPWERAGCCDVPV